jgi:hypothetical protein
MTLLQNVRAGLGRGEAAIAPLMTQLSDHFARRPAIDGIRLTSAANLFS